MLDISKTPLITVEHETTHCQTSKLAEFIAQIQETETVSRAASVHKQAAETVDKLRRAHSSLNTRGRELVKQLRVADDALRNELIQHHGGSEVDVAALVNRQVYSKAESNSVSQAIAHIVEHLLPEAYIRLAETEAVWKEEQARELEILANKRTEETTRLLAAAVEFEEAIEFDTRTTISGALVSEAALLRERAARARREALETERLWTEMRQQAETRRPK